MQTIKNLCLGLFLTIWILLGESFGICQTASRLIATQVQPQGKPWNFMHVDTIMNLNRMFTATPDSAAKALWGPLDTRYARLADTVPSGNFMTKSVAEGAIAQIESDIDTKLNKIDTTNKWLYIGWIPSTSQIISSIGYTPVNPSTLSTVALSGSYTDLNNKPSIPSNTNQLTNGAGFITGINNTMINNALGYTPYNSSNPAGYISSVPAQSFSSLTGKPTTLVGYGIIDAYPLIGNPSNFLTSINSSQITSALGYTPYNGSTNPNGYLTFEVDSSTTNEIELPAQAGNSGKVLTTNGTSPSWITIGNGTVTQVGIASSTLSVSGLVTTSGNLTVNLPTVATSGTYNTVTIDQYGRVTSGSTSTSSAVTRPINSTSFQISTTQAARVSYTVTHTIGLTLVLTSGSSMVYLEISPNNSTWTTISQAGYSDGVAVAVALTKTNTNNVQGEIPAGYYCRLRTQVSGAGTATYTCGQETTF